jgi:hypothetical protein
MGFMKQIPDFKTEQERQQWFIQNADYFTACTVRPIKERAEFPTRADAMAYALKITATDPMSGPYMIYAVVNNSDTWVENVPKKG